MYANLRNWIFTAIPGTCFSDFIYLGIIVFIIAGFFSSRRWGAFVATCIFAVVFKLLDWLVIPGQQLIPMIEQILHMIFLPLVITALYAKRK